MSALVNENFILPVGKCALLLHALATKYMREMQI